MTEPIRPQPSSRPSWDAYFMEITKLVSKRSTCVRRAVGAILLQRPALAVHRNGKG